MNDGGSGVSIAVVFRVSDEGPRGQEWEYVGSVLGFCEVHDGRLFKIDNTSMNKQKSLPLWCQHSNGGDSH